MATVSVVPLRAAAGEATGAIVVVQDITDASAPRRRCAGGRPAKDEFIATLAHELRNPLAPIRNAVEILRDRAAIGADDSTHAAT